jgi:hypothetical protein
MHLIQPLNFKVSSAFRLPQAVLEKVDQVCDQQDMTRSQVFRRSIVQFLKSQSIEQPSVLPDTTKDWAQRSLKRDGQ